MVSRRRESGAMSRPRPPTRPSNAHRRAEPPLGKVGLAGRERTEGHGPRGTSGGWPRTCAMSPARPAGRSHRVNRKQREGQEERPREAAAR